jgi:adsorption protein B
VHETLTGQSAKAVVLHDSEDIVHPLELKLFDRLIERAAVVQLPVLPLPDPNSRWISGHYCDEFAEAHVKELVVREAVGAAVPLAGVGCAIARKPLAQLAAKQDGKPFADGSLTEDYELGLRIGALGLRTMFVRIPATPGQRGVVASRGHFPSSLGCAVRQKARWLGGIALAGWDRLGWSGGLGERWMRVRDRRGPLAALLLVAAYAAALLWSQIWIAEALGAPIRARLDPALVTLLAINGWLLAWRVLMRVGFTTSAYGWREGLMSIPRLFVGNVIAMLAAARAVSLHLGGGARNWDKTRHVFPKELPQ